MKIEELEWYLKYGIEDNYCVKMISFSFFGKALLACLRLNAACVLFENEGLSLFIEVREYQ